MGKSPKYPVLSVQDICDLPIRQIAAPNCILFIWGTNPLLKSVMEVIEAWGFTYKTKAFCWVKTTTNKRYFMGCGYWTRANPEDCWLATKGKPIRISKGVRQLLVSPIGQHSAKPLSVYNRISQLVGDSTSKLELFARRVQPGWTALGYDIDGLDIRQSLVKLVQD